MNKAKKILKIGGLLFVLPAIMAGVCLMAIKPLDAKSGEVGFTAVSILGHVWMPWEQIPSGKVVTVDNDLYQIHTNDPVDEEAVREAAVATTEKIAEERYSVQIAELEKQLDEVNAELETANAALEQRAAEQAAAERERHSRKPQLAGPAFKPLNRQRYPAVVRPQGMDKHLHFQMPPGLPSHPQWTPVR